VRSNVMIGPRNLAYGMNFNRSVFEAPPPTDMLFIASNVDACALILKPSEVNSWRGSRALLYNPESHQCTGARYIYENEWRIFSLLLLDNSKRRSYLPPGVMVEA
jgi:hypothetical protein